jgi:hypothetical protein
MKARYLYSHSRLKIGLALIIALTVISSSHPLILNNPVLASRSSTPTSSIGSGNMAAPSTISQGDDFTAQAPLQIPRTLQSTDLVNSLAFYEVTFITSTTGAIDKIRMDFPAGTGVGAAGIIERVGIGGGTLLKSGSSITYDVTTPVSIPAGTFIRLEMFGIKNPITPSTTFTAMITTRDSGGNLIDGPSPTNVYTIKKIVSSDIADGAITSTKPAESFMMKNRLLNDAAGNAAGWNPNSVTTTFTISTPVDITGCGAGSPCTSVIMWVQNQNAGGLNHFCDVTQVNWFFNEIEVTCSNAPDETDELHYLLVTVPSNIAS